MIAVSILKTKDSLEETIKKINKTNAEMLHVDVLDDTYTDDPFDAGEKILSSKKSLNVHLMVKDQLKYIKKYEKYKPESIILEYELCSDVYKLINRLWNQNIKCGLAIKPETSVSSIRKYLSLIDYVLILSVEPGKGGQTFMKEVVYKIKLLNKLKQRNNLDFKIIIDGGINDETIKLCKGVDIFVSGSFITSNNSYQDAINKLRDSYYK